MHDHAAIRWSGLVLLSILFAWGLGLIGAPAALLLGPMIAGIVLGSFGKTVTIPRSGFIAAQAIIGCLIAGYFRPSLFTTLWLDWPVFLGTTLVTLAFSVFLGYLLMRFGAVPGTAAIWGATPGGAAPMVLLAQAYGADARLVAVMTYMRVLVVVAVASVLLTLIGSDHAASPVSGASFWKPVAPAALGATALVALGGALLGLALRLPAGPMLGAMLIGGAVSWTGIATLATPAPLLAIAYAIIGWRIGLTFNREAVAAAARSMPWIILSALVLVGFCAALGALLGWYLGLDMVTAYLATSPGGMDSIAIMAISTHSDVPLIMALQTMRFLIALALGPRVATWLADRVVRNSERTV